MFYPHHSNIPLICPINVPNIPTGSLTGSLPGVARRCWPSSMARCRGKETGVPGCYLKTIIQNQANRQVSTLWWAHLFVQPETAFRATILWFEMMKYDITIYYMLINEHKSEMLKNHVGQNVCFLGWPSPPHPPGPLRSLQRRWCWMTPAWFHDEKSTGTTSGIQRKIQRWQWKVRKNWGYPKMVDDGRYSYWYLLI
jgi:hypothetical protein